MESIMKGMVLVDRALPPREMNLPSENTETTSRCCMILWHYHTASGEDLQKRPWPAGVVLFISRQPPIAGAKIAVLKVSNRHEIGSHEPIRQSTSTWLTIAYALQEKAIRNSLYNKK